MRDTTKNGAVIACSVALLVLFATPARAQNSGQGVLGICAGWMAMPPLSVNLLSSDCEVLGDFSSVGMAITTNSSPSAYIFANDGEQTIFNVSLLVIAPSNSLSFTVSFEQGGGPSMPAAITLTGTLGPGERVLANALGLTTFNQGTDYTFGNLQGVQSVAGITSYNVWMFQTGKDITGNDESTAIHFSFAGDQLPPGTILLAVAQDEYGNWVFLTPLTVGMQVVPEPSSLLLLGTGLIALAGLARRKRNRRS